MRVRQKHIVDLRLVNRHLATLKWIGTLLHTTVHKHIFAARLQEMAAPRHLMVCTYKSKLHTNSSFFMIFRIVFTIILPHNNHFDQLI